MTDDFDKVDEFNQRLNDAKKILKKIRNDGYDEHSGLYEEALEYFLYDVLEGSDWERLKKEFKL